ncbi:MAG: helix-turn-helix transcriptional regulator [Ignavibacteriae bacterium]|nr:helix-turn-helix transcriptional regulator [Ignavibacteriota bacterium]
MDILKKLGSNIREQRTKLDLSQEMLANNAEIHRTYLGAVERGEKNVSFKNLYKIAKALKVSVSDLTKLI